MRFVVVAALTVSALIGAAAPSEAAVQAGASTTSSQSVSSTNWSIVASTASAAPYTPAAATVTWSIAGGDSYLWLVNTGTAALDSRYTALYTINGVNLGLGSLNLLACIGGSWNETVNLCVGGTVTVLATTSSLITVAAPVPEPVNPGDRIRVEAVVAGVSLAGSATITAQVSRLIGQSRPPVSS